MATWYETATIALSGGGATVAIAAGFRWLRSRESRAVTQIRAEQAANQTQFDREARLWQVIGKLEKDVETMKGEIADLRKEKHRLRGEMHRIELENTLLKLESDELHRALGKEPKYNIAEIVRATPGIPDPPPMPPIPPPAPETP